MTSVSQSTTPFVCPHPASGFCEQLINPTETMGLVCIFHQAFLGTHAVGVTSREHYSV